MYTPEHFAIEETGAIVAMMRANPFAVLVSHGTDGLEATHLPTVTKTDGQQPVRIEAHFARPNRHWRQFKDDGAEAMFIYSGAHSYVHPSWYPSKAATGKVVPTWNYAAVHVYGRARLMQDQETLRAHVAELTDQQESGRDQPWALTDAPDDYVNVMLRGIVGMEFEITRFEGKLKMSQNREEGDRHGVVSGLQNEGTDGARQVADLVQQAIK